MKFKNLIAIFITLVLVCAACESSTPQNTPTPPVDDEEVTDGDDDDENKDNEDNEDGEEIIHPELPDATYALEENLDVRVHPLQTNGLRNDYISFYDVYSDITLFIDFYAPIECEYLPSGEYPLGDGSAMTSAQEYTYVTLETGADFIRCIDGWAVVTAKHDEASGVTTHKVTAYYTIEGGETISLKFEGVFTIKQGM